MSTGRVGGGQQPQVRPQQEPTVQRKDAKETRESKDAKGTEGKGGVGGGKQTGGVAAKGKAKGKDLGTVGELIAGGDNWSLEDEEGDRKRKSRQFFDQEMGDLNELPEDFDANMSMLENVNAAFRGQLAQGLAAGRTFTRGSIGIGGGAEEAPRKKKKKKKKVE